MKFLIACPSLSKPRGSATSSMLSSYPSTAVDTSTLQYFSGMSRPGYCEMAKPVATSLV